MDCPACNRPLQEMTVEDITVDVCKGGCGGIWFDAFELKKVDERHEHAGESLLDIERDENVVVDHDRRRNCPKCGDVVMMRHFFSVRRRVEVDECPQCAGFWLDDGELATIRACFETESERHAAAAECFSEIFDHELKKLEAERTEEREKIRNIARIFRFILPSYYLPGKQKWGLF